MASEGDPQSPMSPHSTVQSSISPRSVRFSGKTEPDRVENPNTTATLFPSPQLTFGVEIECLLFCKREWHKENHGKLDFANKGATAKYPEKPEKLAHLSDKEIFELAKIVMEDEMLAGPDWVTKWAFMNENGEFIWEYMKDLNDYHYAVAKQHAQSVLRGINASARIEQIYCQKSKKNGSTSWVISEDASVGVASKETISLMCEGWMYLNMELKSPIFKYCPKALDQVREVLSALKHQFNDGINFRFFTNETCGMHVHVGTQQRDGHNGKTKMENAGHPFDICRNLFTVCALFEKQIHSAFPLSRVDNRYGFPLSYWLRGTGDVYAGVDAIEDCSTYYDICDLLKGYPTPKHVAYNILNLVDPLKGYKTVEFRQHQGTVDPDEICSWVMFVCGLMRLSYRAGKAGFPVSFLAQHKEVGFGFPEMLDQLNMCDLADYYRMPGRLFEHQEDLPWEIAPWVYDRKYTAVQSVESSYAESGNGDHIYFDLDDEYTQFI
jgi:hypothetical protein